MQVSIQPIMHCLDAEIHSSKQLKGPNSNAVGKKVFTSNRFLNFATMCISLFEAVLTGCISYCLTVCASDKIPRSPGLSLALLSRGSYHLSSSYLLYFLSTPDLTNLYLSCTTQLVSSLDEVIVLMCLYYQITLESLCM